MHTLSLHFPATRPIWRCAQVGCVSSGDLEVLLQPADDMQLTVEITTSADGSATRWQTLLERFTARETPQAHLCIHDFGATPGVIKLRLEQAREEVTHDY